MLTVQLYNDSMYRQRHHTGKSRGGNNMNQTNRVLDVTRFLEIALLGDLLQKRFLRSMSNMGELLKFHGLPYMEEEVVPLSSYLDVSPEQVESMFADKKDVPDTSDKLSTKLDKVIMKQVKRFNLDEVTQKGDFKALQLDTGWVVFDTSDDFIGVFTMGDVNLEFFGLNPEKDLDRDELNEFLNHLVNSYGEYLLETDEGKQILLDILSKS